MFATQPQKEESQSNVSTLQSSVSLVTKPPPHVTSSPLHISDQFSKISLQTRQHDETPRLPHASGATSAVRPIDIWKGDKEKSSQHDNEEYVDLVKRLQLATMTCQVGINDIISTANFLAYNPQEELVKTSSAWSPTSSAPTSPAQEQQPSKWTANPITDHPLVVPCGDSANATDHLEDTTDKFVEFCLTGDVEKSMFGLALKVTSNVDFKVNMRVTSLEDAVKLSDWLNEKEHLQLAATAFDIQDVAL